MFFTQTPSCRRAHYDSKSRSIRLSPLNLTLVVSLIGYSGVTAARVLLSLYALELGASPAEIGLLVASYFALPLVLSWPIGVWADRIGSRGLLMGGLITGVIGMAIPWFAPNLAALYLAGTLSSAAFVFCNVLTQNIIGLLSTPDERARNFSNASLMGSGSNILGPLIAGFAIDHAGHATASLCAAGLLLMALVLVAVWGGTLPAGGGKRAATASSSLRERLSDKAVMSVILITTLVQIGQDLFMFYMPIYGHSIGLSASAIGAILASFATASSLVRVVLPPIIKRFGEEKLLASTFVVAALSFVMLPMSENALILGLISFCFGLGMGCGMPITMMMLFSRAPDGRSGETIGLRQAVNNFVRVITPPIFGVIASVAGLLPVFLVSALLMGGGALAVRPKTSPDKPDDK